MRYMQTCYVGHQYAKRRLSVTAHFVTPAHIVTPKVTICADIYFLPPLVRRETEREREREFIMIVKVVSRYLISVTSGPHFSCPPSDSAIYFDL